MICQSESGHRWPTSAGFRCLPRCFLCPACDPPALGGEELWSEADSSCSGQPIHLWQFLRELLLKPHSYGRCIRWLNKEKGASRMLQERQILLSGHQGAPRFTFTETVMNMIPVSVPVYMRLR